jgi:hypothetical protein
MRLVTGIGILEIVLSRSNLKALLEALDDPDSSCTVYWPEAIEREHWHPKALLVDLPLTLQITVESDDGHPDVPFEIQSWRQMAEELGIDPAGS